jgi:uncharacterized protein (DUF2342 family)
MGVAPGRQWWPCPEVFVTGVEAADETGGAVDHDDLAVVAEIQLKAIAPAPRAEGTYVHACRLQRGHVTLGKVMAADAVVKQMHGDAV